MDAFELMKQLVPVFGPAGDEKEIRNRIAEIAKPFADEIRTDTLGNLIVRKRGGGKRVMFAAHMDSIGFMATGIDEGGFVRVAAVGGLDPVTLINTPVRFRNGTRGLVHKTCDSKLSELKITDLYVDIGARDKKSAEKLVKPGDTAVYDTDIFETAGGAIVSPYCDNRSCCAAQLMALEMLAGKKTENDLYFVFTVQEELGLRGARPAAFALEPDYAIACDVTLSADLPEFKAGANSVMWKGAAVKIMDRSVISDTGVVKTLEKLARKLGIASQPDIISGGGTDAGAIQNSREGVRSAGISVPCRYVHSPQEMVSKADIESTAALLAAFAESDLK